MVEAVVAISAGLVAGSIALVGFGLDSIVEVSSGLIILWQFRHPLPESRERTALRLMALSFFALAAYVTVESVRTLAGGHDPEHSPVGIALACLSLVIMPLLSRAQRRTGQELASTAVVADSTQTQLCAWLSAALLVGLLLNSTLGWGWADPLAGLVIAAVAAREGRQAWRGAAADRASSRARTPAPAAREIAASDLTWSPPTSPRRGRCSQEACARAWASRLSRIVVLAPRVRSTRRRRPRAHPGREPKGGRRQDETVSSSASAALSTVTVSPSRTFPPRTALARRSPISRWTSRRSGRAPYAGS